MLLKICNFFVWTFMNLSWLRVFVTPFGSNWFKLDPNWSNLFKNFKMDQIGLNLIKVDQTGLNWIKIDRIRSNWIKSDQCSSNLIKLDQTESKLLKLDQSWQNLIKTDQCGSKRVKMDHIGLKLVLVQIGSKFGLCELGLWAIWTT